MTMKKQVCRWLGKALLAGFIALGLLCLFSALWYNVPVHFDNADGATEYKWEPHRFYSRGTEGFALGRTNNDGFNNLSDYTPGERVDILLMGSSHMEGFCVAQEENAAAVLNALFAGEKYAYNIATAGHIFPYCAEHLDRALSVYAPETAVLELGTLSFDPAFLDAAADGTLPVFSSHTGGLLTALQKLPFLRLFYTKYIRNDNEALQAATKAEAPVSPENYEASLERLMRHIAEVGAAHGTELVLVYMPTLRLDAQGRGLIDEAPGDKERFQRLAEENGIVFLDLSEAFLASLEAGEPVYGFSNTAPGQGHINRRGHRLFAEAVYAWLSQKEG